MNFDFAKSHGPLSDKSLIENWKYVALIVEDLRNMISKSNKKIRSLLSCIPTEGKNLNMLNEKSFSNFSTFSEQKLFNSEEIFLQKMYKFL